MQFDRKRLTIAIVLALLVAIVIGILIWVSYLATANKSLFGSEVVKIKNLSEATRDLPANLRDTINNSLYRIIEVNKKNPTNINDAFIRTGSESQTDPNDEKLYRKTFIVDIPSVKQSYQVAYDYSSNKAIVEDQENLYVTVRCLDVNMLIYGDFSCKNIPDQGEANLDPILDVLPHSTLTYQIQAVIDDVTRKVSVSVIFYPTSEDYRSGIDAAIAKYKQQALDWIKSQGFDPTKYTINYSY